MTVGYGVGDHRLLIIGFLKSCLLGAYPPSIVRASARILNSRIPTVEEKYSETFEQLVIENRLIQRLGEAGKPSTISTPKLNSTWHTRRENAGRSSWGKYCSRQNPPFGSNVRKPIGL